MMVLPTLPNMKPACVMMTGLATAIMETALDDLSNYLIVTRSLHLPITWRKVSFHLPPPSHLYSPSSLVWTLEINTCFCGPMTTLDDVISGFPSFVHTTVPVTLQVNWTALPATAIREALDGIPAWRHVNNASGNHGDTPTHSTPKQ